MSKKKVCLEITKCNDCPYMGTKQLSLVHTDPVTRKPFNYIYYCKYCNDVISSVCKIGNDYTKYPNVNIPDWCPLTKTEDEDNIIKGLNDLNPGDVFSFEQPGDSDNITLYMKTDTINNDIITIIDLNTGRLLDIPIDFVERHDLKLNLYKFDIQDIYNDNTSEK